MAAKIYPIVRFLRIYSNLANLSFIASVTTSSARCFSSARHKARHVLQNTGIYAHSSVYKIFSYDDAIYEDLEECYMMSSEQRIKRRNYWIKHFGNCVNERIKK